MKSAVVKKGKDVGIEVYWTWWQLEALMANYERAGYTVEDEDGREEMRGM